MKKYMENVPPKVEPTTVPPAPAAEPKKVDTIAPTTPDYKALLEVEKTEKAKKETQLSQAEHVIEELKKKAKESADAGLPIDLEEITKAATDAATEAARRETTKLLGEQTQETLEDELARIEDPNKRELVKFHLENSIVRTGFSRSSILKDIEKAVAIADAPRREAERKELEKSLSAKQNQGAPNSSGQNPGGTEQEKLSDAEEAQVKIIASRSGKTVEEVRAKLIANKKR